MATNDITDLCRAARAATDAIVNADPPGLTPTGRSCAQLAAELSDAASRVPRAVTDACAFLDIAACEQLTCELQDVAALQAAVLFLGRRLINSNVAAILELHPTLRSQLTPTLHVGAILGALSQQLLETLSFDQPRTRRVA
jgi:hypothetical protein